MGDAVTDVTGEVGATVVPTRDRIVFATAGLFRRQGLNGTGMKQIATEAQAPFGSVYHFFPGGKEELADEVLRRSGAFYLALWESFVPAGADPADAVEAFFAGAAETLVATGYEDACPIATVALEVASTNERLRAVTGDVYESWIQAMAAHVEHAGASPAQARAVAVAVVAAIEGAFVLSRSLRSTEPMLAAGAVAAQAVRAVLP
jgi:AcrR family transcriptional regulator